MTKNEFFELPPGTLVSYDGTVFLLVSPIRGPDNERGWATAWPLRVVDIYSTWSVDWGRIRVVALGHSG